MAHRRMGPIPNKKRRFSLSRDDREILRVTRSCASFVRGSAITAYVTLLSRLPDQSTSTMLQREHVTVRPMWSRGPQPARKKIQNRDLVIVQATTLVFVLRV
jgi:hypothetical protein